MTEGSAMRTVLLFSFITMMAISSGCTQHKDHAAAPPALEAKIKRFAPTVIVGDTSRLSEGDRNALRKLIQAAGIMDQLYFRQSWSGSQAMRDRLEKDTTSGGRERYRYYMINMGPWSRLDQNEPFIEGAPAKPPRANFYPDMMSKEEFTAWVATLPETEKRKATGFFYTIRRDAQGKLTSVPYSEEYRDLLEEAATLLRDAAALTTTPTLREYLTKRADAFLTDQYYDSDVAWMKLDSPIDVTIGPYEVYMDELFNYKAAFEAFITLRNDDETAKLSIFSAHLQEIENNLPIEKRFRNPKLGALAPIRVVDEIAIGGEARAGVQTAAFNLPNDERVTQAFGSKRVMLKNVQEAKFTMILVPIAALLLDSTQQSAIAFEPFFTHILAHELMHGLGPHTITVNGTQTTARQAMRELSSALEEAKADIAGLFALQFLIDRNILPATMERELYTTFLAGVFRSVRFGIDDAHGRGMALQFNYLTDEGAFIANEAAGTFAVNYTKIKDAVRKLTGDIMTIQAEGSYDKAKAMLDRYAVIRPTMQHALDKLSALPVDIAPRFPLAR
jgi:hypothetical protein